MDDQLRPLAYQLDKRAAEAVSQWKFQPAMFGNTAVPVILNVDVSFRVMGH